jgi:hypothetical protein
MGLAKKYIESKIMELQREFEKLGLVVSEVIVKDPKILIELEKMDIGGILKLKRKPLFISGKNYNRIRLNENEFGKLFGISFVKEK